MKPEYERIIHLPHHVSAFRPRMSNYDRAAQFAPFAALTGYDAAVAETARLTDSKVELDEYEKADINETLMIITDKIGEQPEVSVTYFSSDKTKSGGAYLCVKAAVKKIDTYLRILILTDGTKIPIDDIFDIHMRS